VATTGPALYPGSGTFPGSTTYPGQGNVPLLEVLFSTDDASVATPNWVNVTSKVRSYSKVVGRDSEQGEIDTGKATLELDNRDRTFDWVSNPLIRPMNRWWIRSKFAGVIQSRFVGYADSYQQSWPGRGADAKTVVNLSDEMKLLAQKKVLGTEPLRDSYADLVQFDNPSGYWRFQDVNLKRTISITSSTGDLYEDHLEDTFVYRSEVGVTDWSGSGYAISNQSPILGEFSETGGGSLTIPAGSLLTNLNADAGGLQGSGAIEFWFKKSGNPGANTSFMAGPISGSFTPNRLWSCALLTTGILRFAYLDGNNTAFSVDTVAALADNTWYHVVALRDATPNLLRIYINGVQSNTAADGIQWADATNPAGNMVITGITGITIDLAEIATYPSIATVPISAARIAAHYTAGTARGFPDQATVFRARDVLDAVDSNAPRDLGTASGRNNIPSYMRLQSALDLLREVVQVELPDGFLFVTRDGTIKLLNNAHRSAAPYDTVQATFDDDGTDFPYLDLVLDQSEGFLYNTWSVTRRAGLPQIASDATSIGRYGEKPKAITGIPISSTDFIPSQIAAALLTKYKDPLTRIPPLELTTTIPDVAEAILARDIGDRIRVLRTPVGGGTRHDLTMFIQKIEETAGQGDTPWRVRWTVTPL
jgi:hypothetical protein